MQNSCPYSSILPLLSLGDFSCVSKLIWMQSLFWPFKFVLFFYDDMPALYYQWIPWNKCDHVAEGGEWITQSSWILVLWTLPVAFTGQTALIQLLPAASLRKYFFTFFLVNTVQCSFYGSVNWSKESSGTNIYSRQWKTDFFFVLDWKFIRGIGWIQS